MSYNDHKPRTSNYGLYRKQFTDGDTAADSGI